MKIAKLTLRFPYPAVSGSQLRDYNLIRCLARHHDIALFSFVDALPSEQDYEHMRQFCKHIYVEIGGKKSVRAGLRNMFELVPYHVTSFRSASMRRAVGRYVAENDVDVMDASVIQMTQYFPRGTGATLVLDQQNADRMVWGRLAAGHSNKLVRAVAYVNLLKMKAYEDRIYPRLGMAVSVCQEDLEITRSFAPEGLHLHLAPNGVDFNYFAPIPETQENPNALLLCGGLSQEATVDAVHYFVSDLWPAIRENRPGSELWLVGRAPVKAIRDLSGTDGITVEASVPDVRPYYARAALVVAPYRLGGGTKLKVLNAMSMGKAVVATPVGAQGLDVSSKALRISETGDQFVRDVLHLLDRREERQAIGSLAREEVVRKYDWDAIAAGYCEALTNVSHNSPSLPAISDAQIRLALGAGS